jgi:hypothetical protein
MRSVRVLNHRLARHVLAVAVWFAVAGLVLAPGLAYALATDGFEPDGTAAQAKAIALDAAPQSRTLYPTSDADWVSFDAVAGVGYIIETQNSGPEYTDTRLTLYASDAVTEIATDDDSAGTKASRIGWLATASGTYYIKVAGYHTGITGPYTLSLTRAGSVSGAVTDAYSNAAVAGIQVELYEYVQQADDGIVVGGWDIVQTAKSDATGQYSFPAVKPGVRRIGFWDRTGVYTEQYYARASRVDDAASIQIQAGVATTGISAALQPSNPPVLPPADVPVTVGLTVPSTVPYRSARISGKLSDPAGRAIGNAPVQLQYSKNGSTWAALATVNTNASGEFVHVASPSARIWYRAFSSQRPGYAPAYSPTRKVMPRVSLTTPSAAKVMKAGRYYPVYSTLKPRHKAGTKPVRIYKYKRVKVKGKWTWKSYGYVRATAYNYSTYTRCKVKLRLPSKGSWRLIALHPSDSLNARTLSKYKYVTVR